MMIILIRYLCGKTIDPNRLKYAVYYYYFYSLHCWVSFSGFSEAYFEYYNYNTLYFTQWNSKWNEGMTVQVKCGI